jgi:hypothetical protein
MKDYTATLGEDWSVLEKLLPEGWRDKAKELGALQRCRAFRDADALLRTLLIHVVEGHSFRDTAVRAHLWGGATVSDVAIFKRLKAAGPWLRWMAEQMMKLRVKPECWELLGEERHARIVDGTTVQEPGSKGISWRVHYGIELPSLRCTEVHVTRSRVGESFKRFAVSPGDVLIGDRGYAHAQGIAKVVLSGGDVIVRVNLTNIPFQDAQGRRFPLLERVRSLSDDEIGDWDVWVPYERGLIPARICAVRLDQVSQEKAVQRAWKNNRKKGTVKPETLEAARYLMVLTTLDRSIPARTILESFRGRWQIELVFKRLKSLLGLGYLRKKDSESAYAWIYAKLLVAFLIEAIIRSARYFPPWVYPLKAEGRPRARLKPKAQATTHTLEGDPLDPRRDQRRPIYDCPQARYLLEELG